MYFLSEYEYFIALSFLLSLTVYFVRSTSELYLKLFPPFLLATLIEELFATWLWAHGKNNLTIYNFFTTFEFWFYFWVLSRVLINPRVKTFIRWAMVIYPIVAVINILYLEGMNSFHTVTYSIGCLIIVMLCIYFFFELFRMPKSIKLQNNPAFWICSGLLFFYCCGFPLFAMVKFWSGVSGVFIKNFDSIINILNIFLYSLFSIAFLCRIKIRKYTSS